MIELSEKDVQRFENKYEPVTESGCWIWTAWRATNGYGSFRINKKTHSAHRVSYQLYKGKINDDLHVLHICDVRECVNPNHLFLGTNLDNITDAVNKGRKKHGPNYVRPKGLKYKPMSVEGKKAHWRFPEEIRNKVVSMLKEGLPQRKIAELTGMTQPNVSRLKKEYL